MDAEFLSWVIDGAGCAIAACDVRGEVVVSNAAARELLPAGKLQADHPLLRALRGERLNDLEMTVTPGGADARAVIVNAGPIFDRKGKPAGAVATYQQSDWRGRLRAEASAGPLEDLARLAVLQFSDWCAVDLVEGQHTRRVAVGHKGPAKPGVDPAGAGDLLSRVLLSGKPEISSFYIIVPLLGGSKVLGAIAFARADSDHAFQEADVRLAEELASGAARALENARLCSESERAKKDLELLLECTSEGIFRIDVDGICTFVNGSAAAILGFAREEMLGKKMHGLIHHHDREGNPYPLERCPIYRSFLEKRGCRIDDEVFFRSDGSPLPVEYSSYPILDGALLGAVVTFSDITQRKLAEEALLLSESKFRALYDSVTEGIYQTSPNGELLAANRALVEMLGYNSELELRALDVKDLYVDPEDRARYTAQLEREGKLSNVELKLKRKDGQIITVVENARAIFDERKTVVYYEGTLGLKRYE